MKWRGGTLKTEILSTQFLVHRTLDRILAAAHLVTIIQTTVRKRAAVRTKHLTEIQAEYFTGLIMEEMAASALTRRVLAEAEKLVPLHRLDINLQVNMTNTVEAAPRLG